MFLPACQRPDELLKDNSTDSPDHARLLVGQWSRRYNKLHPHSSLCYLSLRQYAEQSRQREHGLRLE
ncbi:MULTISPECIES: integrase core domain-containing protein [Corynebacterium]|uniref:integrase core domain-containing protein n=1 Tax=Corynebacterium TaxID=1716 RepID=UPI00143B1F9F